MTDAQELTALLSELIAFPSITPEDKGCQAFILTYLKELGFHGQAYDAPPVSNCFAKWGEKKPLFVFAGHTDVVPVGNLEAWNTPPFELHQREGRLYGRGVADMKGSLAAMLIAAKRFTKKHKNPHGSLGFLLTSGEEGDHFHLGTPYLLKELEKQNCHPDFCVLGEPTCQNKIGDVIKIGRRGSLTGKLTHQGKQGHVAYPHLAINPIHQILSALKELSDTIWDEGNADFDPTTFQITHIHSGGQANNIIPGEITVHFNLRYATTHTEDSLKKIIEDCFSFHQLRPSILWQANGKPFLTQKGRLLSVTQNIIESITHKKPECSTSGGTSDARFIAPHGIEVIELGPVNASIHQVNEWVSLDDLMILSDIYLAIAEALLIDP